MKLRNRQSRTERVTVDLAAITSEAVEAATVPLQERITALEAEHASLRNARTAYVSMIAEDITAALAGAPGCAHKGSCKCYRKGLEDAQGFAREAAALAQEDPS